MRRPSSRISTVPADTRTSTYADRCVCGTDVLPKNWTVRKLSVPLLAASGVKRLVAERDLEIEVMKEIAAKRW
jgi:hypothetical protein